MAVYYVDATGGNDGDTGLVGHAWQTISKVNGESFSAGDSVLFEKGEEWHEKLTIPSSGSSGNEITFGYYGSGADPLIRASDTDDKVTGWAGPDGNGEYAKVYAVEPKVIVGDGTALDRGTLGSLAATEWVYNAGSLYLGQDPATYSTLEVGQRDSGIEIDNKTYIVLDGLDVRGAAGKGAIHVHTDSSNITIQNCNVAESVNGVRVDGSDYVTVDTCVASEINGQGDGGLGDGVNFRSEVGDASDACTNATVTGCTLTSNISRHSITAVALLTGTLSHNTVASIRIEPNAGESATNLTVSNNTADRIHFSGSAATAFSGFTIANNTISATSGAVPITLTHASGTNNVYGNTATSTVADQPIVLHGDNGAGGTCNFYNNLFYGVDYGFRIDGGGTVNIYRNLIKATGTGTAKNDSGIRTVVDAGTTLTVYYNIIDGFYTNIQLNHADTVALFYNNVIANHIDRGVYLYNVALSATFKNNIFYAGAGITEHIFERTADTYIGDYNVFYEDGNFFDSAESGNTNLAGWQALGHDTNSITADPLLVDAAGSTFSFKACSPCRNAGVDVSLTSDYDENTVPYGYTPDIGAYEYQGIPLTYTVLLGSSL